MSDISVTSPHSADANETVALGQSPVREAVMTNAAAKAA
jgi:hypothetical protein